MQSNGVVMRLYDGYTKLGDLPSFRTISRDAFGPECFLKRIDVMERAGYKELKVTDDAGNLCTPSGSSASLIAIKISFIAQIAEQIASAMRYLVCEKRVCHADCYAHNIICKEAADSGVYPNNTVHAVLADFGAANYVAPGGSEADSLLKKFERLEVRAFGYLLDDLLSKCLTSEDLAGAADLGQGTEEATKVLGWTAFLRQLCNRCSAFESDGVADFDGVCAEIEAQKQKGGF